jgi:hypothetical protein
MIHRSVGLASVCALIASITSSARADVPCAAERAAWTKEPKVETATALAKCDVEAERFGEAASALAPYVDPNGPKVPSAEVKKIYEAARAHVLALKIEVDVLGADVAIDGASVGRSPLVEPLFVTPGSHTIVVKADAYAPVTLMAAGGAGESRALNVRVIPQRRDVVGYDMPSTQPAPPGRGRSGVVLIVGYASAGVAAAIGVALAALAIGKSSSADDQRKAIAGAGGNTTTCAAPAGAFVDPCASLHDTLSKRDSLANGSLVSFAVGGALLGATIAYALWPQGRSRDRWEPTLARVRPEPLVGRGVGGLVVTGSF